MPLVGIRVLSKIALYSFCAYISIIELSKTACWYPKVLTYKFIEELTNATCTHQNY